MVRRYGTGPITVDVILASASPRRRELLSQLVAEFRVLAGNVDEEALTTDNPWDTAERLAIAKARAIDALPESLVIAADTVVAIQTSEGYIQLAKPASEEAAREMLAILSGNAHLVITGVCLRLGVELVSFTETTQVEFKSLNPDEVAAYVATGEPMDKAGAYAIQGGAARFVERRTGSLTNVVGLPLERLRAEIERLVPELLQ